MIHVDLCLIKGVDADVDYPESPPPPDYFSPPGSPELMAPPQELSVRALESETNGASLLPLSA